MRPGFLKQDSREIAQCVGPWEPPCCLMQLTARTKPGQRGQFPHFVARCNKLADFMHPGFRQIVARDATGMHARSILLGFSKRRFARDRPLPLRPEKALVASRNKGKRLTGRIRVPMNPALSGRAPVAAAGGELRVSGRYRQAVSESL